jgi:hypothetical protein
MPPTITIPAAQSHFGATVATNFFLRATILDGELWYWQWINYDQMEEYDINF